MCENNVSIPMSNSFASPERIKTKVPSFEIHWLKLLHLSIFFFDLALCWRRDKNHKTNVSNKMIKERRSRRIVWKHAFSITQRVLRIPNGFNTTEKKHREENEDDEEDEKKSTEFPNDKIRCIHISGAMCAYVRWTRQEIHVIWMRRMR